MKNPTKAPSSPSIMPDCWNAQGRLVTAVPTIVFQALKMMTSEPCFSPTGAIEKWIVKSEEE